MVDSKEFAIGHVTSKDGTLIGYKYLGTGPGVILVHGGMMASQNFIKLAQLLSKDFTVFVPDRRGRGLSGAFGPNYSLKTESEDLQALISKTASERIFGLSAGAICVLQTAIVEPSLKKIVLYEPPVPFPEVNPIAWGDRYEAAIADKNLGKAFFTILKGTGDPSFFTSLPTFLISPLLSVGIKSDAKKAKEDQVSLETLIRSMHYDLIIIRESKSIINRFKDIHADLLLMGGTKSIGTLKHSLDALSAILPGAKRITLQELGHIAADNDEHPEKIATELTAFFK